MKRLPILFVLAVAVAIFSCSEKRTNEDIAADAAKMYYEHLITGRYNEYVAGFLGTDSIPESYRKQLMTNAKQFMALQKEEHHGIREVRIVNAVTDSVRKQTDVFLMLCFGDSVNEEIVVPMVERNGNWHMK